MAALVAQLAALIAGIALLGWALSRYVHSRRDASLILYRIDHGLCRGCGYSLQRRAVCRVRRAVSAARGKWRSYTTPGVCLTTRKPDDVLHEALQPDPLPCLPPQSPERE